MDVLIATLRPVRVGALEDPLILPVIGNDAYDMSHPGSMATALELFRVEGADGCCAGFQGLGTASFWL